MTSVLRAVGQRFGKLPLLTRRAVIAVGLVVPTTLVMLAVLSVDDEADAHGSLESPPSRIYYCRFFDNPENPSIPACQAAVAASGKQAVYDWNEVNQPNAAGNHRAVVPDGQLCSGGRAKYRGFDLARADWPATRMTAGAWYEFRPRFTTPHVGTVAYYLTRDGYDPTRPLHWSDLEATPFLTVTRTTYPADFTATAQLPAGKTGRHLIYMIWQRSDSPEAFYSCSDVDFGGGGPAPAPPSHDHAPPTPVDLGAQPTGSPNDVPPHHHEPPAVQEPPAGDHDEPPTHHEPPPPHHQEPAPGPNPPGGGSATEASTPPAWSPGTTYQVGALVTHLGRVYRCVQAHTSLAGWEPPATPALWVGVVEAPAGQNPAWQPNTGYATGQLVSYNGRLYRCLQGHTSLPGWEPVNTPALWQPV